MGERVKVKKSEPPESKEILAEAIVNIGKAVEHLSEDSGLNHRAIVILLQAHSKVPKGQIEAVLESMKQLRSWYCRR